MSNTTTPETMWDATDIGEMISDHHGKYVYLMVCELAGTLGWDGDMPDMYDLDDMAWQSDEALEWLNDNVCADGIHIGWYEGAIMLMPTEWWEDES